MTTESPLWDLCAAVLAAAALLVALSRVAQAARTRRLQPQADVTAYGMRQYTARQAARRRGEVDRARGLRGSDHG